MENRVLKANQKPFIYQSNLHLLFSKIENEYYES